MIANIVDEDGNAVDLGKIITFICDITITNQNNKKFNFLSRHQYLFNEIEKRHSYYFDCENTNYPVLQDHYKITIEDEIFYVPVCFAVVEFKLRPFWDQDFYKWMEKKADQPRNMIKEYKKITGIDLSKRTQIQHNAYEQYLKWLKDRKKKEKIPYRIEQDSPEDQTY
jgi:hypothetical protein